MWLIEAMVCLLAAPWVQLSVSAGNEWPHNTLRHHWLMPVSCHFRYCKAPLVTSLTRVSGAITSVLTFTFTCTVPSCLSVLGFNSTVPGAPSFIVSYSASGLPMRIISFCSILFSVPSRLPVIKRFRDE